MNPAVLMALLVCGGAGALLIGMVIALEVTTPPIPDEDPDEQP